MFPVADVIPSRTTPWMTIGLVVANIAFVLYAASLPPADAHVWAERLAFKPADASWLTATLSLFVHQNAAHMLLNVIVLWIFGDNAEDQLGHVRFLFLYLLAGYVGWLSVLWTTTWPANPTVALVGPGGAIAGVLGAYFVMFPRSRVPGTRARAVDCRRDRASRRARGRSMVLAAGTQSCEAGRAVRRPRLVVVALPRRCRGGNARRPRDQTT